MGKQNGNEISKGKFFPKYVQKGSVGSTRMETRHGCKLSEIQAHQQTEGKKVIMISNVYSNFYNQTKYIFINLKL